MAGAAAVALLLTGCGVEEESTGNYPPPIDLPPGYGRMDDETPTDGESSTDGETASDGTDGGAEREFTEWELERHAMPPPERPAGITDPSDDGAIATAIYFVELNTYAAETTMTELILEASEQECNFCERFIDLIDDARERGEYAENTSLTVLEAVADQGQDADTWVVTVHIREADSTIVDREGQRLEDLPGAAFTQWVVVRWDGEFWRIAESTVERIEEAGA